MNLLSTNIAGGITPPVSMKKIEFIDVLSNPTFMFGVVIGALTVLVLRLIIRFIVIIKNTNKDSTLDDDISAEDLKQSLITKAISKLSIIIICVTVLLFFIADYIK